MQQSPKSELEFSPEIVEELRRFYYACAAGDTAAFADAIADENGVLMVGTDPAEWWDEHATIVRTAESQMAALGGAMPISAGDEPRAYREGPVGWADDRPHLTLPDGTRPPLRLTAVFSERPDGRWRIVQSHFFSIGAANEDVAPGVIG